MSRCQRTINKWRLSLFSLDTLMDMATTSGLEPHITIKNPTAQRKRAASESLQKAA